MAQYRFLADCYIGTQFYFAGTTASTADVGGSLPANFVPPAAVDPLDTPAVTAYWNVGPQATPLVRQQWSTIPVSPPAVYWKLINPSIGTYQLTGAGASLGVKNVSGLGLP